MFYLWSYRPEINIYLFIYLYVNSSALVPLRGQKNDKIMIIYTIIDLNNKHIDGHESKPAMNIIAIIEVS